MEDIFCLLQPLNLDGATAWCLSLVEVPTAVPLNSMKGSRLPERKYIYACIDLTAIKKLA